MAARTVRRRAKRTSHIVRISDRNPASSPMGSSLGTAYDANGWDVVAGVNAINLSQTHAFL